nr:12876_t:CDS:2 [Entrophospora candida]
MTNFLLEVNVEICKIDDEVVYDWTVSTMTCAVTVEVSAVLTIVVTTSILILIHRHGDAESINEIDNQENDTESINENGNESNNESGNESNNESDNKPSARHPICFGNASRARRLHATQAKKNGRRQ